MSQEIINNTRATMEKSIDHLNRELGKIRTGRANPAMLDGILVEAYGSEVPINQVATINVSEARQLRISPFDKKMIEDIDNAINKANIGIAPVNDGENIRINIPPLTEESRRDYVKDAKKYGENEKVSIRNIRKSAIDDLKKAEMSDDERKAWEEDVQALTNEFNKKIDETIVNKEKEIMTI